MAINKDKPFVGFHTRIGEKNAVNALIKLIEQGLKPMGFNAIILELNPGFAYRCFPEYSNGTLDYEDAKKIKEVCKKHDIDVIPLFQCLSHQSDHLVTGGKPWPLIEAHPEFSERPDLIDGAEWPDLYCQSWCASNDDIYKYIFPMMDEIIEAFEATSVHIGLDEVFEIGEDACPRCKGKDRAELLAHTIKIVHDHLAQKNIETMMWGDRLLDAEKLGYQMWEADKFGMHPAIDMVDKVTRDIVITDWHYDLHSQGYPSVEVFMKGGFNTIAALGSNPDQAEHFWKHCLEYIYMGNKFKWEGKMLGLMVTHWAHFSNEIAEQILGGIHGTIGKSEHPYASSEVGRTIKTIVPRGKLLRK